MNLLQVRQIATEDIPLVVAIHLESSHRFFLSFLGPEFLSHFYQAILKDPTGIAFIAERDRVGSGFVIGSTQPSGLYKRLLKKHLFGFIRTSLVGFIRKPSILPRLLRAFRLPNIQSPTQNCCLLMSIAVDPACQSKGVGKALVQAFLEEAVKGEWIL